jgi:peptidoglycan biosynthesis protein MviN/MurJ (putative lipid II flippase)
MVLLFEALANLILSVALARPMGIAGVALATAVPALLGSTLFVPAYVARRLGVPISRLTRGALLPALALVLALSVVHLLMNVWLPSSSYAAILAKVAATLFLALPVALALFPRDERDAALGLARRVGSRILWRRANR